MNEKKKDEGNSENLYHYADVGQTMALAVRCSHTVTRTRASTFWMLCTNKVSFALSLISTKDTPVFEERTQRKKNVMLSDQMRWVVNVECTNSLPNRDSTARATTEK